MGKDIALGFGLTIGVGLTIIGLAFRFGPVDNSDAGALASFVSMPFKNCTASPPDTSTRPREDRSKRPAPPRTASYSARVSP